MPKIELNKKLIVIIVGIILVALISFFMISPLFNKARRIGGELKTLENEMISVRGIINGRKKVQQEGHLLTRQEVSFAINEMTKIGTALNISFLSTSPQKIKKPQGSKYPVLPIEMNLQSEYKDLGLFFGALEGLEKSIVTVKSFQIELDQEILPQVKTELVVDVYLQKGEDE